MNIIVTNTLSTNQFHDAATLVRLCRLVDNTKGISFLENDMNVIEDFPGFFLMYNGSTLVSFLSVFVPNQEECEIYANTLPRYRKKGYFRELFRMAEEKIRNYGISKIYFVNEPACLAGSEALSRLGAKFDKSEYLMAYNMRLQPKPRGILQVQTDETEEGVLLHTFRNEIPVGTVNVYIEQNVATIHGVEIDAKFRGRHFGVETILLTVDYLKNHNCSKIILHVSGANKVAYHLYSHHGFVHVDQLDYWIKSV